MELCCRQELRLARDPPDGGLPVLLLPRRDLHPALEVRLSARPFHAGHHARFSTRSEAAGMSDFAAPDKDDPDKRASCSRVQWPSNLSRVQALEAVAASRVRRDMSSLSAAKDSWASA